MIVKEAVYGSHTALITRSNTAMGRLISLGLSQDGFQFMIPKDRSLRYTGSSKKPQSVGGKSTAFWAHDSSEEEISNIIEEIKQNHWKLDVFVHIMEPYIDPYQTSDSEKRKWEIEIAAFVKDRVHLLRSVAELMGGQGGGRIILISEFPGTAQDYVRRIAEGIAESLLKGLAWEFAAQRVAFNGIFTSAIKNKKNKTRYRSREFADRQSAKDFQQEEVVKTVRYMAQIDNRCLTGQVVQICGL
ncbi:MAG: SDR family oxidoreductase [Pseudomonadota bacterium]